MIYACTARILLYCGHRLTGQRGSFSLDSRHKLPPVFNP
jgi:hypothetical protein